MTVLLQSYFAGLMQATGADHVVLIRDAAATTSRPSPVSPNTEEKKQRPSMNALSGLSCPPPILPYRQVSIDGLNNHKKKNSYSTKKHSLRDFFAEVAPKLSTLPTFDKKMEDGGDQSSNKISPMIISNKRRGGRSPQKKKNRPLKEFLVEVEDLLAIAQR
jgi:hypothetical protein